MFLNPTPGLPGQRDEPVLLWADIEDLIQAPRVIDAPLKRPGSQSRSRLVREETPEGGRRFANR